MIFDLDYNELNNCWLVALRLLEKDDEESRAELQRMEEQNLIDFREV